jgi:hypothetical protein
MTERHADQEMNDELSEMVHSMKKLRRLYVRTWDDLDPDDRERLTRRFGKARDELTTLTEMVSAGREGLTDADVDRLLHEDSPGT